MMKTLRNSKLIVGLWIVITIFPVIVIPLHFLFVSHTGMSCQISLTETGNESVGPLLVHCPICSFDFFPAIITPFYHTLQRFNYLRRINNDVIIPFFFVTASLHVQLRAPPYVSF